MLFVCMAKTRGRELTACCGVEAGLTSALDLEVSFQPANLVERRTRSRMALSCESADSSSIAVYGSLWQRKLYLQLSYSSAEAIWTWQVLPSSAIDVWSA